MIHTEERESLSVAVTARARELTDDWARRAIAVDPLGVGANARQIALEAWLMEQLAQVHVLLQMLVAARQPDGVLNVPLVE